VPVSILTRIEAAERGRLLNVRSYQVDLDLTTGATTFRSTTRILFDASAPGSGTFLDVRPHALLSVTLNGRAIDIATLSDGRLPLESLAGANEIVAVADMNYSNECEGLHRYADPADGQVYVYAFVYPDNAPRVFSCFDQPDLKAPYTISVTVPPGWQVLGNSSATEMEPGRWKLGGIPSLATYLITLAAGPYASFYAEHDKIRLGLHCRASLAHALKTDVDEVFEITGQCLDACARFFGIRYPFGKLDQLFAPEFSILSLDHPGCILLREQFLFSSAATASERETRAVVLAHGISLMWLAGLVTSRWWDDLWLGQAFADYAAHRIASEATRFPGPPVTFSARRKGQAYVADQRPSTHPVKLEGRDVQTVLLELDRISYFKGHSVLEQLATVIGDERFRAGLKLYFARHAYGSATFGDFLAALGDAAGTDLTGWAEKWLNTANVNVLEPRVVITSGRITAAAIAQAAPGSHPTLRPHTLNVGLYYRDARSAIVRVDIDGALTEVPGLVARPAPRLLLLNDGDLTYAKVRFDEASLAALPAMLHELSPVNRAMVWCALLLGVQDGVFPAASHLALVTRMIAMETELSILAEVLEQARGDVTDRFLHPADRPAAMAKVAEALRRRLAAVEPGDERQITIFRVLIDFSADPTELSGWLAGHGLPAGLVLDTDLGWRVRYRLTVLGSLDEADIAAAYRADPSSQSAQFAGKCRAARPDPAAKEWAWAAITGDEALSSYELWALAEGFWQPEQAELTAPYVRRFFAEIADAARLRGDLVLDVLLRFLYPRYSATPETLRLAARLLTRDDIPLPLHRRVTDFTDDLRRVVEARAAFASRGRAAQPGTVNTSET
jgi:aminopeptidase N